MRPDNHAYLIMDISNKMDDVYFMQYTNRAISDKPYVKESNEFLKFAAIRNYSIA